MGLKDLVEGLTSPGNGDESSASDVDELMQKWDLSGMTMAELSSLSTLIFLGKVLLAASVVAFGPALVLEYVPAKKVITGDVANAGSSAGKTQRLLLALAGGGLMAEAALHLLPHLFMPHDHGDHGGDHHHHDEHGHSVRDALGDSCTLIAVGFLTAFAIDRFIGVKWGGSSGSGGAGGHAEGAGKLSGNASAGDGGDDDHEDDDFVRVTTAPTASVDRHAVTNPDGKEDSHSIALPSTGSSSKNVVDGVATAVDGATGGGANEWPAPLADTAEGETEPNTCPALTANEGDSETPLEKKESSVGDESTGAETTATATSERNLSSSSSSSYSKAVVFTDEPPAEIDAPCEATADSIEDSSGLTRYGNPKTPAPTDDVSAGAVSEKVEGLKGGALVSDAHAVSGKEGHHDDHDDHHGDADAGAYVTLAVDFLHNVIDGIGIGGAYAVGGDVMGHTTAVLKLIHEIQHEVGDVATLVQCGMSKHHAIHIQHTTAAGVFLGVAISLGAGAFPSGLLAACLALSAGATFHLASGTVLGPVLAIPADVGGSAQAFLEVGALAAGAGGVVAIGLAEKWAGIGH